MTRFPNKSKYEIGYDINKRNSARKRTYGSKKQQFTNSKIHIVSRKTILNSNNGFTGLPEEY